MSLKYLPPRTQSKNFIFRIYNFWSGQMNTANKNSSRTVATPCSKLRTWLDAYICFVCSGLARYSI